MNNREDEIQIDLLELMLFLRKKIVIILVAALVFTIGGFVLTQFFMTPQYTASTKLFVLNRSNENSVVSSDFQISNYMINDYKELIRGKNVTRVVIEKLGLDLSNKQLADKITVTSGTDTRILQIDVEDPDPALAARIANEVREISSQQMVDIMQVDAATMLYEAEVPAAPSSPNVMRNTVLACLVGIVGAVGVLAVVFIMDDRIRTEEDVERYLGLSTLGVIPVVKELEAINAAAKANAAKNAKKK